MNELIHDLIVNQYVNKLKGLKVCLNKAKLHAEANKFDANKFLDMKLAPDMLNFTAQIQMISDNAKGAVARLTGTENPPIADTEKSWEDLMNRIDKTLDFITKFRPSDFQKYADQKITFPWYPGAHLKGHDYLTSFAIPNFYFHLTTAYALLRSSGVPIGKSDFMGEINWQK